jgi:hypothetical protein
MPRNHFDFLKFLKIQKPAKNHLDAPGRLFQHGAKGAAFKHQD